ncbi:MAG: hypothetical protein SF162_11715 [bacterium]|nr:hypothetical protein [bacterium]
MERVAFLVEQTNEMLTCLLNPETLVLRRAAGVRVRESVGSLLTGAQLSDDPLLFTGGGRTELELELLFDVALSGSTVTAEDVRDLTGPLWNLSENTIGTESYRQPPLVRLIWGRRWNIPGVIASVSEHLDDFTADGAPRRSWLKMRMLRVRELNAPIADAPFTQQGLGIETPLDEIDIEAELAEENIRYHPVIEGDRLDALAFAFYGDPAYWRLLALFNDLDAPYALTPGLILNIPPAPYIVEQVLRMAETGVESARISFSSILRLPLFSPLREQL